MAHASMRNPATLGKAPLALTRSWWGFVNARRRAEEGLRRIARDFLRQESRQLRGGALGREGSTRVRPTTGLSATRIGTTCAPMGSSTCIAGGGEVARLAAWQSTQSNSGLGTGAEWLEPSSRSDSTAVGGWEWKAPSPRSCKLCPATTAPRYRTMPSAQDARWKPDRCLV